MGGFRTKTGKLCKPTMNLSDMKMSLHTDQQSMIFDELMATRQKLEAENQRLRDELQDSRMMIQFLKMKIKGEPSCLKDFEKNEKKRQQKLSKRGTFVNPMKRERKFEVQVGDTTPKEIRFLTRGRGPPSRRTQTSGTRSSCHS